ncbi:MAG: M20/M25/M40 family metallo-hydrolase [Beijerinckiaceae bacterium]
MKLVTLLAATVITALTLPVLAQTAAAPPSAATVAVQRMTEHERFKAAVAKIESEHERIVTETITITEIEAPPFKEETRAKAYMEMLRAHGLQDIEMDAEGNVMGIRKGTGTGDGKLVVMSAHLDTVFPAGTNVKVKREGDVLTAPGIGDDSHSLATLLAYIRAMDAVGIKTKHDILFVGTVGEEGLGDLRGVRYFFSKGKYKDRVQSFFSMDGTNPARLVNGGVGSKRYRVTFSGPGGHSYGAFGLVNPAYAMAEATSLFSRIQVPTRPKTTFSIGVVGGGTSVNSIPIDIWMEVDMRSEHPAALAALEKRFLEIVQQAAATENASRSTKEGPIKADAKLIGDRPAGSTDPQTELVQLATAAIVAHGYRPQGTNPFLAYSSTDSNIPMSLGIPALTIGSGGVGERSHSLDERLTLEKAESTRGKSVSLAILLAAAVME